MLSLKSPYEDYPIFIITLLYISKKYSQNAVNLSKKQLGKAFEMHVLDIKKNSMKEEKDSTQEHEEKVDQTQDSAAEEHTAEEVELTELEKKDLEIQALNDKHLRLYSELKEKLELYKTAGEDVFKALLPVMDDFERAKKSMEDSQDYDSLKVGVDLIFNKLLTIFKTNGVEPMTDIIGNDFDSEIHEAITQIPAPNKKLKGKVVDVVEQGYTLKEKVIRFAKVVVGK